MKTIIFSDTHLTSKVHKKTFNFLQDLIAQADKIIINGDFWDSYKTTFDDFINSGRSKLFSSLLKKNAIYLYGNHDPQELQDARNNVFSTQQLREYLHFQNGKIYKIEHGDWYCDFKKNTFKQKIVHLIPRKAVWFGNLAGNLVANRVTKKHISWNQKLNIYLQSAWQRSRELGSPADWYICGHTHTPFIDLKNHFINIGHIAFGKASYVVIDDNGIELKNVRY